MKTLPSQLPIFIEVAKAKSFSAAARNLGISTPAVSKAINKLENEWKIKLFHRSSHSLSLTSVGRNLVHDLEPAIDTIFSSIISNSERNTALGGEIKVNLPNTSLGVDTLLPHIVAFNHRHPAVQFDLHFNDANVDLIANGFDLGIGTALNQDSRLIAKRLFSSNIGLYASKNYLQLNGQPTRPNHLNSYRCLGVRSLETGKLRGVPLLEDGQESLFVPQGSIIVDSFIAAKHLACNNWGIVGLAEWMVKKELKSGELIPILKEHWGLKLPVYLYFSSREYMPQSVRALIDYLSEVDFD